MWLPVYLFGYMHSVTYTKEPAEFLKNQHRFCYCTTDIGMTSESQINYVFVNAMIRVLQFSHQNKKDGFLYAEHTPYSLCIYALQVNQEYTCQPLC